MFEQRCDTDEEYKQLVESKIFKIDIQAPIKTHPKLKMPDIKEFS